MQLRSLLIFLLLHVPLPAVAQLQQAELQQAEPEKQVHWAMAAWFGTGWYQVDDNRTTYIFRIPPRQTVRTSGWHEDGKRKLGVEILYPVALGLHTLDDLPDFLEFDNYGTITFTPGVQVEIPVTDRWYLRPFGHLGVGYEKESDEWASIWYGGLKSRYLLGERERFNWSLLSAVYFGGYKPEYKNRGQYASVMGGFEFDNKLGELTWGGEQMWLNWHLTYDYFFDNINFHASEENVVSIKDQWELGLALGTGDKRMKFWFMGFEHVGLSFKMSSNGEYQAISFNLRSPFTL